MITSTGGGFFGNPVTDDSIMAFALDDPREASSSTAGSPPPPLSCRRGETPIPELEHCHVDRMRYNERASDPRAAARDRRTCQNRRSHGSRRRRIISADAGIRHCGTEPSIMLLVPAGLIAALAYRRKRNA